MQQQPRFDQAPILTLTKGERLDDRASNREMQQPFPFRRHSRAFGHIDEAKLVGPIGIERRIELVAGDVVIGRLAWPITKEHELGERSWHSFEHGFVIDLGLIDYGRVDRN